jgi:hypothetical protein
LHRRCYAQTLAQAAEPASNGSLVEGHPTADPRRGEPLSRQSEQFHVVALQGHDEVTSDGDSARRHGTLERFAGTENYTSPLVEQVTNVLRAPCCR